MRPGGGARARRLPGLEAPAGVHHLRTVADAEIPNLARAIQYAREGDDLDDE